MQLVIQMIGLISKCNVTWRVRLLQLLSLWVKNLIAVSTAFGDVPPGLGPRSPKGPKSPKGSRSPKGPRSPNFHQTVILVVIPPQNSINIDKISKSWKNLKSLRSPWDWKAFQSCFVRYSRKVMLDCRHFTSMYFNRFKAKAVCNSYS